MLALQLCLLPVFVVSVLGYAAFPLEDDGTVPLGVVAIIVGFFIAVVFVVVTKAETIPTLFAFVPYLGNHPFTHSLDSP